MANHTHDDNSSDEARQQQWRTAATVDLQRLEHAHNAYRQAVNDYANAQAFGWTGEIARCYRAMVAARRQWEQLQRDTAWVGW